MGFNFGAFAAGAIKGSGDLMEKQHKETKDSIDTSMKFAYEQGLPYVRAREKKLQTFKGYASDLSSMNLSADQISVVMGKSESYIKEFISSSIAEKKRKPKWEIGSQVNPTGTITPWEDVQLGVADPESIKPIKAPNRTSLFSSMTGITGDGSGFNQMKNRAQSEMEGITGASYKDVTAAASDTYKYSLGSEGTITMADSSASMGSEYTTIQLADLKRNSPIIYGNLLRNSKFSEKEQDRAEFQWKFEKKKEELEEKLFDKKIAMGIPTLQLKGELDTLIYNAKINEYGTSPENGYWLSTLALMDEQSLGIDADPERIEMLEKNQFTMSILVDNQLQRTAKAGQVVSYSQLQSTFKNRVLQILAKTVNPDNTLWITNADGTVDFDFSRELGQKLAKKARQQAANEFADSARASSARGVPVSNYLTAFMDFNPYLDPDSATLPLAPTNKADVDDKQMYVIKVVVPLEHTKAQRLDVKKNGSGDIISYQPAEKKGFVEGKDAPTPRVVVEYPRQWRYEKSSGENVKLKIDAQAKKSVDNAARLEQDLINSQLRAVNDRGSEVVNGQFTQTNPLPEAPVSLWKQVVNKFSDFKEDSKKYENKAKENARKQPSTDEVTRLKNLYRSTFSSLRSFNEPPSDEDVRAALNDIISGSTNGDHIQWAQNVLDSISETME